MGNERDPFEPGKPIHTYGENLPGELMEVQNKLKRSLQELAQKALGVATKKDVIDGKWSAPDQN